MQIWSITSLEECEMKLDYKYNNTEIHDNTLMYNWLIVVFSFPLCKFYNMFIDNRTEYEVYLESWKFKQKKQKMFQKTFVTYYKLT